MAFYFGTPGFLAAGQSQTVTPPPPPPVTTAGTLPGQIVTGITQVLTGERSGAVQTGLAVARQLPGVGTVVGAVESALGLFGIDLGGLLGTKSKANWRRALGRVYRAFVLGYVPEPPPSMLAQLVKLWAEAGDSTGAQLWDRIVSVFGIPTEKGGTKEGFGAGAPRGSKSAEAQPGFKAGLDRFLAAVGV